MQKRTFQIYRYDPDKDTKPYMQTIEVELDGNERMLLDALMKLKAMDPRSHSVVRAAKACADRTP
jgi:succinate dehydrogenase / fumarate reductase iron-sulfur subunit